ncbi:quinone-dependent dihydroorotate dehydrogenase [Candidatus Uhrbacteria bacterium]|nr:quinone-dependent dihydroorotate dehydrogenase [Candidatus Uhrbacteria bacterium]
MFATGFFRWSYANLLKPVLFKMDPEYVHDTFVRIGAWLGKAEWSRSLVGALFRYEHPSLVTDVCGIRFANPVGLPAGFDKNARMTGIMPAVGFGFEEIGSVTGEPCAGNPKPRLWRLPESKALVVYYGLMNDGSEAIAGRLKGQRFAIPIGVSVAKTNSPATVETQAGIADYVKAMRTFVDAGVGEFFVVNISCPNAFGGEPYAEPSRLEALLAAVDAVPTPKPVFVKITADTTMDRLDAILEVVARHRIHGLIISNLTKKRDQATIVQTELTAEMKGGIGGKPVQPLADALIRHAYAKAGGRLAIIGVGGVFTAEDAYRKIRAGASLVQLVTGMIFEGPQVVGDINRGIVRLLERDGFACVKDAVGADHRPKT